ncbi:hypothetical protein ACMYM1_23395, partial [Salmonella enterica subsp. enterica serovar Enteritidis]|uniref:hypothetical protein n=1 Tax=Salmonella enterica TaxID=28901 RepID=UPI0039E83341
LETGTAVPSPRTPSPPGGVFFIPKEVGCRFHLYRLAGFKDENLVIMTKSMMHRGCSLSCDHSNND